MRIFDDQKRTDVRRLDTPATSGFRSGMTSSRLIAGKLGALYNPQTEIPSEMHALIRAIDAMICRIP